MPETTASIVLRLKDDASKQLKGLSDSFKKFGSAIKGLAVAAGAIGGVGVAIALMAEKGEKVIALRSSFKTLADGIGENADEMLAAMQTATSGLVSNAELIEKANNAILLGLPVTTESMAEMSEAAVVLGRAMGLNATKALESVIVGLGRQSKLWLDNLGIMVDVEAGNKKLAESLGKTAAELTDGERKTAFFNAAMDEMRSKVEELGKVTLGFGGEIALLRVSIVNFKDDLFAFASVLGDEVLNAWENVTNESAEFGRALKFNTEAAITFTKTALAGLVRGFGFVQVAGAAVLEIYLRSILAYDTFTKAIGATNKQWMVSAETIKQVEEGLEGLEFDTQRSVDATEALASNIEMIDVGDFQRQMAGVASNTNAAAAAVEKLAQETRDAKEEAASLAKESKKVADAFITAFEGGIPALSREELAKTAGNLAAALKTELPDLGLISTEDLQRIVTTLSDAQAERIEAEKTAAKELADIQVAGVNSALEGFAKFLSDPAGAVTDAMGFAVSSAITAATGIPIDPATVSAIIDALSKELPAMLFEGVSEVLHRVIGELPLLIGNIIPDLITPLLKEMPKIVDEFVRNLDPMIDKIIDAMPKLVDAFAFAFARTNWVAIYFRIIGVVIERIFPGLQALVFEMMKAAGVKLVEAGRDFFNSQLPTIFNNLRVNLSNVLTQAWQDTGNEITAWWNRTIWQNLSEDLGELLTSLAAQFDEQILQPFAEAISLAIQSFGEAIVNFGILFDEQVTQPFVEQVTELWTASVEIISEVWEATFGLLPGIARQAGEDIAGPFGAVVREFNRAVERLSGISLPGIGGGDGGGLIEQVTGISFQQGGIVPRTGPIFAHQGEMVLNRQQQQEVFAGGGGDTIEINIDARGATVDFIEGVAEAVSRAIEGNRRGSASRLRRVINREG